MSQTFFSKLAPDEKLNRLTQLGQSKGKLTVWIKGQVEKHHYTVLNFDHARSEMVLDSKESFATQGQSLLCTFDMRGMSFFSKVILLKSVGGNWILQFNEELFKVERRSSFRLLTYPIYQVWAEFDLGETYDGGKVIDLKTKASQTGLFRNFLKMVNNQEVSHSSLKIRVQDLSVTGMALHVGEIENKYFPKDCIFKDVMIDFQDDIINVPEVKVVYVVNYLSADKNLKKYKVGLQFLNLPTAVDDQLGKKINKLLRDVDFNKDFENFIK